MVLHFEVFTNCKRFKLKCFVFKYGFVFHFVCYQLKAKAFQKNWLKITLVEITVATL